MSEAVTTTVGKLEGKEIGVTIKNADKEIKVPVKFTNTEDAKSWDKTYDSQKFQSWVSKFGSNKLQLKQIEIQSVDLFGSNVGFIKLKADIRREDGTEVPGIVFIRGDAVAVLVVLRNPETKQDSVLLVKQARSAIGDKEFLELPAGMMDEEGHFSGVAAKELKEETGIEISSSDLMDMTSLAYGSDCGGVVPSAGGCDERIRLFAVRPQLSQERVAEIEKKTFGNEKENEQIKICMVPLRQLWKRTTDAKALTAALLYNELNRAGKLKGPRPDRVESESPRPAKPAYLRVEKLTPDAKGVNIRLIVLSVPTPQGEAQPQSGTRGSYGVSLVGDETGVVLMRMRTPTPTFKEGDHIVVRNGHILMEKGHMRLDVDEWGKVLVEGVSEGVPEGSPIKVNKDKNVSDVEYVVVPSDRRRPNRNNNRRRGGGFGRGGF